MIQPLLSIWHRWRKSIAYQLGYVDGWHDAVREIRHEREAIRRRASR